MEYVDWKNIVDNLEKDIERLKLTLEINGKFLATAKYELDKCKKPELPPIKE